MMMVRYVSYIMFESFVTVIFKQTKTALSLASSDEVKEALLSSRFASEVYNRLLLWCYHFDVLTAGS